MCAVVRLHSKAARAVRGKFGDLGGRAAEVLPPHAVKVRPRSEFWLVPHQRTAVGHMLTHTFVQNERILWSRFRRDYPFWAAQPGAVHQSKSTMDTAFREQSYAPCMRMVGGVRFARTHMWGAARRVGPNPIAAGGRECARGAGRPAPSSVFGGCACARPSAEGSGTTVKSVLYMWEQWCRRPTLVDIMQPFEAASCKHTFRACE